MQYTTHYNLNLPEGTDIVNPLVQDNPNYTAIDTALYNNKVRVVGNATEVKSGTVHAVTRSDSDIDVMRFTATGDWITGDTMTVDGSPVSVYLQDGSAPLTGAYVINTEVVAVINGSRVTLYGAQSLPALDASNVNYDNTGSGLSASNVQDALDEIVSDIPSIPTYTALSPVVGTTPVTIPAGVSEVQICVSFGAMSFDEHMLTIEPSKTFREGYYVNNTNSALAVFTWDNVTRQIALSGASFSGTDYLSTATLQIYVK